jgi:hypothetical protein
VLVRLKGESFSTDFATGGKLRKMVEEKELGAGLFLGVMEI